ncbi:unknown [Firmicutes bacterium CAG:460]|nr:unknown [Firmicutes bacterium CAG:460]
MYIVENELLEEIIKNIIKYINELDLITKDKDKTFFFDNTNEFNKVINRVIKIVNVYQR